MPLSADRVRACVAGAAAGGDGRVHFCFRFPREYNISKRRQMASFFCQRRLALLELLFCLVFQKQNCMLQQTPVHLTARIQLMLYPLVAADVRRRCLLSCSAFVALARGYNSEARVCF